MQTNKTNDPFSQDDVIDLQDYVSLVIRRRKAFLITFLTIFSLVAAYTFLMQPVYEATATLRVKDDKSKLSHLEELTLGGGTSPVNAEIEILKSRTNAEKVVKRLQLYFAITPEKGTPLFKILELTATPKVKSLSILLTGLDSFIVQDENGAPLGEGKSGLLFKKDKVTILIDNIQGEAGDQARIDIQSFNTFVANFRNITSAEENPKQTNIIKLTYRSTDPERARDIVNNLIQAYLEQTISFKTEEASRTALFLEEQLEKIKQDLDVAERNLEIFKRSSGVVQLDAEALELIKTLSETEKSRAGIYLQKKQTEFALSSLKDAMLRNETYSPSVFHEDPLMAGIATKLADLEIQKQSLLADYTPQHPLVKALQEQINELQKKIESTYNSSRNNFGKQEETISRQLVVYDAELRKLPAAERELAKLTRLYKVNADIYTFLLQKREETNIARASTISNVDIVDQAITPDNPVKPKKVLYLLLGFMAGSFVGIFIVFVQEFLDNTIKDADTVKRELNLPILAVIPHIPPAAEAGMDNEKHASLITHYEPKSSISEAFRNLRTSIHFSGISKKRQVMMVTSCMPYEGKSTIIGNLAIILSQTGAKVLLLDCDLRRPSMHKLYGNAKAPGLTELLAGDTNIDVIIHNTQIVGLDFISAGTTPPNPAELLGSDKMKNMLQTFRERYDVILLDAPPILAVTDALLLSNMTDMVFMILELGRVPIKAAVHVREMLQNVGAPLAGVVLNDKSEEGLQRYGYYGEKYYRYGYYYGYGQYSEDHAKQKPRGIRAWMHRLLKK